MLTLLAFIVFRDSSCDWAVIETGIGGKLDATNLIVPEVCILTPVELEHTDILGSTVTEIALQKAGIMKAGAPAFSSTQNPDAEMVFRKQAEEFSIQVKFLDESLVSLKTVLSKSGTEMEAVFDDGSTLNTKLSLLGRFQSENACLAYLACREALRKSGTVIDLHTAELALSQCRLAGRTEIIEYCGKTLVIDGAHTPETLKKVNEAIKEVFGSRGILILVQCPGKHKWYGRNPCPLI